MTDLGERVASLEAYQRSMHRRLEKMEKTLDTIAKDMHGAKFAGRLVIGAAMTVGVVAGWFLQWWMR